MIKRAVWILVIAYIPLFPPSYFVCKYAVLNSLHFLGQMIIVKYIFQETGTIVFALNIYCSFAVHIYR